MIGKVRLFTCKRDVLRANICSSVWKLLVIWENMVSGDLPPHCWGSVERRGIFRCITVHFNHSSIQCKYPLSLGLSTVTWFERLPCLGWRLFVSNAWRAALPEGYLRGRRGSGSVF